MSDLKKMREALHLLASTLFGPIKEDQTHYLRRLASLGGDDLKVYAVKPTNDGGILTVKDARKIWEALQIKAALPEAACSDDTRRLDALEKDVNEHGPLLLHNLRTTGNFRGLGLASTGRSLRKAIDDMSPPAASVPSPQLEKP